MHKMSLMWEKLRNAVFARKFKLGIFSQFNLNVYAQNGRDVWGKVCSLSYHLIFGAKIRIFFLPKLIKRVVTGWNRGIIFGVKIQIVIWDEIIRIFALKYKKSSIDFNSIFEQKFIFWLKDFFKNNWIFAPKLRYLNIS